MLLKLSATIFTEKFKNNAPKSKKLKHFQNPFSDNRVYQKAKKDRNNKPYHCVEKVTPYEV